MKVAVIKTKDFTKTIENATSLVVDRKFIIASKLDSLFRINIDVEIMRTDGSKYTSTFSVTEYVFEAAYIEEVVGEKSNKTTTMAAVICTDNIAKRIENATSIYIEDDGCITMVKVELLVNGDTTTNYYCVKTMKLEYAFIEDIDVTKTDFSMSGIISQLHLKYPEQDTAKVQPSMSNFISKKLLESSEEIQEELPQEKCEDVD